MPLDFDIQSTVDQMLAVTKQTAGESGKAAKAVAANFIKNRRDRLELLAELRLDGDLSNEKFASRLEDEKLILEAELNALSVFSKSTAQNVAQSAINIFQTAVVNALPDILKEPPSAPTAHS